MEKKGLPPEVVVSIASVNDLKPTVRAARSSTVCSRWGSERPNRSRCHATIERRRILEIRGSAHSSIKHHSRYTRNGSVNLSERKSGSAAFGDAETDSGGLSRSAHHLLWRPVSRESQSRDEP